MYRPPSTLFMKYILYEYTMSGEGVKSLSLTLVMREEGRVVGGMDGTSVTELSSFIVLVAFLASFRYVDFATRV